MEPLHLSPVFQAIRLRLAALVNAERSRPALAEWLEALS